MDKTSKLKTSKLKTNNPLNNYIVSTQEDSHKITLAKGFVAALQEMIETQNSNSDSISNLVGFELNSKTATTLVIEDYVLPIFRPQWIRRCLNLTSIKIGFSPSIPIINFEGAIFRPIDIDNNPEREGMNKLIELVRVEDIQGLLDTANIPQDCIYWLGEGLGQVKICDTIDKLTKHFEYLSDIMKDIGDTDLYEYYKNYNNDSEWYWYDLARVIPLDMDRATELIQQLGKDKSYTFKTLVCNRLSQSEVFNLGQFILTLYENRENGERKKKYSEHQEFIDKVRTITLSDEGRFI